MLVRPHVHAEWDLLRWMLLLALAGALILVLAGRIAGAAGLDLPREPVRLPQEIDAWSLPMSERERQTAMPAEDVSLQVWQAIDLQHREDYDQAIAVWSGIQMPCETEVWKQIALGQAFLATGEVEEACAALRVARSLEPDNAVVHYFFGLLRLEQAYLANEWYDGVGPGQGHLVAFPLADVVPHTKSMYYLAAITELESALTQADHVPHDLSLVPAEWPSRAVMPPTVHDLLLATRANNFVPKAHNILGSLYLERGALEQAEEHMDAAVAGGLKVIYGYSDLGRSYDQGARHGDALRAYLKAAQQEPEKIPALRKAWDSFTKALW